MEKDNAAVAEKDNRFYWLQLPKTFFKDYKIKILESYENGCCFIILYQKLMLESINRKGLLRFSKEKPYTNAQLAAVLGVPTPIVRKGLKELVELELVIMKEDGTIYIPAVVNMTSSISEDALKRRARRKKNDDEES